MADRYGQKQIRNIGDKNAVSGPGGGIVGRGPDGALRAYLGPDHAMDCQSDDSKESVAETARLQQEAQARIDAGRHDTVGSAPPIPAEHLPWRAP